MAWFKDDVGIIDSKLVFDSEFGTGTLPLKS